MRGAYGIGLEGPWGEVSHLLCSAEPHWPSYTVIAREGTDTIATARVAPTYAVFSPPSGGTVCIDGSDRRIVVTSSPRRTPAELLHPLLGHAGGIVAWWAGRESFHAGGFVVAGSAWGVVARRGGGKSSTLAQLDAAGVPIVADDLLVVDAASVFAGPRTLDLRQDAALHLNLGKAMGHIGLRDRWRLELGASPVTTRLRGWIVLEWGDTLAARSLGGGEMLRVLGAQRAVNLPPVDPAALIDLASLPAWSIQRPREIEMLPRVVELVLDVTSR
jgi:hypothetical protein